MTLLKLRLHSALIGGLLAVSLGLSACGGSASSNDSAFYDDAQITTCFIDDVGIATADVEFTNEGDSALERVDIEVGFSDGDEYIDPGLAEFADVPAGAAVNAQARGPIVEPGIDLTCVLQPERP